MDSIGKYYLVREGWACNICGKIYFTNKKRKPHCGQAPYVLTHAKIKDVTAEEARKLCQK